MRPEPEVPQRRRRATPPRWPPTSRPTSTSLLTGPALTPLAVVVGHQPDGGHHHHEDPVGAVQLLPGRRHRQPVRLHRRAHLAGHRQPDQPGRHRALRLPGVGARTATSPPPGTRNYWRTGMPYLDTITYKPIPDTQQLLASLNSGVVDIIHTDTARPITADPGQHVAGLRRRLQHVAGEPDMGCILLNLSKAPFNNLKVRQAAAMAISSAAVRPGDRQRGHRDHQRVFVRARPTTCPTTATPRTTCPRPSSWCPRSRRRAARSPSRSDHTPDPKRRQDRRVPPAGQLAAGGHAGHPQPDPPGHDHQHRPDRRPSRPRRGASSVPSTPTSTTSSGRPTNARRPAFAINMARNTDPTCRRR